MGYKNEKVTPNEVLLLEERLKQEHQSTRPEATADYFFLVTAVDTVLRQRALSNTQLEAGIVEGGDDGGIDAVYTFIDGVLLEEVGNIAAKARPHIELEILQVKNERGFKEIPLQILADHIPLLLQLDQLDQVKASLQKEFNARVLERFDDFREAYLKLDRHHPDLTVRFRYVTKAAEGPGPKAEFKARRLEGKVLESFSHAKASVEFVGAAELNAMSRQRVSSTLELRVSEGPISSERGGYACLTGLADYYAFITDPSGRLREEIFEDNIRGYEGLTAINKGIATTLHDDSNSGPDFWWLNNGITITGLQVRQSGKRLIVTDPQIVNGLQTSRAIHSYFAEQVSPPIDSMDNRQILVRAIETEEDDVASQIIKATNSQNRVPAASLRSTEPFQRTLEEYLGRRGYFYERKRNQYKNQGKPRRQVVEVLEMAQAVGAILVYRPDTSRARPSSWLREKEYQKVFKPNINLDAYLKCIEIMSAVDQFLSDREEFKTSQDRSNIRFHLARVATAFALSSSRPPAAKVAMLDVSTFTTNALQPVLEFILDSRREAEKGTGISDESLLAKGPEWVRVIDRRLSRYTQKMRWPKKYIGAWQT